MHLTLDDYLLALRGEIPLAALVRRAHGHLLEVCGVCAAEWETRGEDGQPVPLPRLDVTADEPRDYDAPEAWLIIQEQVDWRKTRLARRREAARLAREDLNRLLRLPMDAWPGRVARARTRFRSRAFAELLVAECRRRVRKQPQQAAALAALVPEALAWTSAQPDLAWPAALLTRAAAHRANALRVAGDLAAAASGFRQLRERVNLQSPQDPALKAEIDSLEASLAIGLRAFAQAETLLNRAISAYQQACVPDGVIRSCIKLGNLMRTLGRPEEALSHHARAAELLDAESDPYLFACTVTGRVNALCDLDRAGEAKRLLVFHTTVYAGADDAYTDSIHRLLCGRVALGLGRLGEAVRRLREARDAHLELGRDYDAILTSLYLADALLAAGKMSELRDLAAALVPLFRSRGVARETLASLGLLARAAAAETVSAAVVEEVRRRLEATEHTPRERPEATAEYSGG